MLTMVGVTMPFFSYSSLVQSPPAAVFQALARPANTLKLSPPDMNLELIEAPECLHDGARVVWKARRFGLSKQIVQVVTAFTDNEHFTEEQVEGPFRRMVHVHRFEPADNGTRLTDEFDFDPPGGMLGFLLTEAAIRRELQAAFEYRERLLPGFMAEL